MKLVGVRHTGSVQNKRKDKVREHTPCMLPLSVYSYMCMSVFLHSFCGKLGSVMYFCTPDLTTR